jgi:hypothetical protein
MASLIAAAILVAVAIVLNRRRALSGAAQLLYDGAAGGVLSAQGQSAKNGSLRTRFAWQLTTEVRMGS